MFPLATSERKPAHPAHVQDMHEDVFFFVCFLCFFVGSFLCFMEEERRRRRQRGREGWLVGGLGIGPIHCGGRRHQVTVRRVSSSSRGPFRVDRVNRVFGPRVQRRHDVHQIPMRRWRLHGRQSTVWRRMGSHQGPEVDALRSASSKARQTAQERPLQAQIGSHTLSSNGHDCTSGNWIKNEKQRRSSSIRRCRDRHGFAIRSPQGQFSLRFQRHPILARTKVAQLEATHSTSHPVRGSVEAAEAVRTRAAKRRTGCEDDAVPNNTHTRVGGVDWDKDVGVAGRERRGRF